LLATVVKVAEQEQAALLLVEVVEHIQVMAAVTAATAGLAILHKAVAAVLVVTQETAVQVKALIPAVKVVLVLAVQEGAVLPAEAVAA
jgi:hypothetical protein